MSGLPKGWVEYVTGSGWTNGESRVEFWRDAGEYRAVLRNSDTIGFFPTREAAFDAIAAAKAAKIGGEG